MFEAGLVSITFREMDVAELIRATAEAGLKHIEWGSDVHAPNHDTQRLLQIVHLQKEYDINCSSYGTYFYLGLMPIEELPNYIRAAKLLGTNILRLWAGKKNAESYSQDEKEAFFAQCKQAAKLAEDACVTLCLECHRNSYTETAEGALELMKAVNSPAFRMYWQPNPSTSFDDNISYIRLVRDYIVHIHAFNIKGYTGYPLSEAADDWKQYLDEIGGDHIILLESMPGSESGILNREAESLRSIIG